MNENKKNVPKRRFKEFENAEAWRHRKLDEITDVRDGTHDSPQYFSKGHEFITSKNVKDGYINYDDIKYISDADFNKINKRSKVDINDILMGMIGTIGNTALVREKPDFAIKNVALIKDVKSVYYLYLYHYLQSPSILKQLDEGMDGGTQKFIALDKIRNLLIAIPCNKEQLKVGNYIEHLDNLITLHRRKLEKIKALKKAYLTEMFPAEGECKPKLRFAGLTGDWEQQTFSDYYKICSGYAFKYQDYIENGVAIVNGESIQHGKVENTKFNYLPESFKSQYANFILKEGDIVVGLNRPITDGQLKIARIPNHLDESLLYQRAGKIKYINNVNHDFSFVLLEKEILKYTLKEAIGSDQPFISASKLEKWKMLFPKSSDEQYKIGTFFTYIDKIINLQQRKLEKLQNIKKAYLNEMFV